MVLFSVIEMATEAVSSPINMDEVQVQNILSSFFPFFIIIVTFKPPGVCVLCFNQYLR